MNKVKVESYTMRGCEKEVHETIVSDQYRTQHKNFDGSVLHVTVSVQPAEKHLQKPKPKLRNKNGYSKVVQYTHFKCAFCQKPLTIRQASKLNPYHYNVTCPAHAYLAYVFNVPLWLRSRQKHLKKKFKL